MAGGIAADPSRRQKRRLDMARRTRLLIAALAVVGMSAAVPAQARDYRHYRHYEHHHRGGNAAAAAIIGGIIGLGVGAAIAGSAPPAYYPPPGYYPPPAVYYGSPYYGRPY
jgi:hypothetical protein